MKQYISKSEDETKELAATLAKQITKGVIALSGDLGTGKTTFAAGFAKGLGITEKITSPTFVLIRQHQIPSSQKIFYHLDLYRLEKRGDFQTLGLKDLIKDPNNLVIIEWAEKVKRLLPQNTTWVIFENIMQNKRRIVVK